jgi:hypothetical protein
MERALGKKNFSAEGKEMAAPTMLSSSEHAGPGKLHSVTLVVLGSRWAALVVLVSPWLLLQCVLNAYSSNSFVFDKNCLNFD